MDVKTREMAQQVRETAQELGSRAKAMGSAAWERAKSGCDNLQDKAATGLKATDRTIRTHPYQTIGIAFGVGVLLGFLLRPKK